MSTKQTEQIKEKFIPKHEDQQTNQQSTQKQPLPNTVFSMLQKMEKQFAAALPKHIPIDRFMRVTITELRKNPKLGDCTPVSLMGALMQAAQDGLEPGMDGQCFLIPRYNKKTHSLEVSYQRGYQGELELARRTGDYSLLLVRAVHENDEFEFEEGSDNHLHFKRGMTNRGNVIAYFCFTKNRTGDESFMVMSREEVEGHRDRFASTRDETGKIFGNWVDNFDSMALKTVLKQHLKYQPKAHELATKLVQDDMVINYDETRGILDYETPTIVPDSE